MTNARPGLTALVLCLAFSGVAAANNCTDQASGSWSSPATWANCGGTIPQVGDTVTIANSVITLNTDVSVVSVVLNGPNAQLLFDGAAPRTLACSVSSGDCLKCIDGAEPCIDTSAGTSTNTLTVAAPNLASGFAAIAHRYQVPFAPVSLRLAHIVISNAGAGAAIFHNGAAGEGSLVVTDSRISNVSDAIDANTGVLTVQRCWFSGITGSRTILPDLAGTVTITDNTETNVVANGTFFHSVNTPTNGLVFTGNAVLSDPTGTADRALYNGNKQPNLGTVPSTISYNLAKAYAGTSVAAIGYCGGVTSAHCVIDHNVIETYFQGINYGDYNDTAYNIGTANALNTGGQGVYICFACDYATSTFDTALLDSNNGNIGQFFLGGNRPAASPVSTNLTSIGMFPDTGTSIGLNLGEGIVLEHAITDASISNSLLSGWTHGVFSMNPNNTFVGTGTGGVGIFNMDVHNSAAAPYLLVAGTNVGITPPHPSATYGDLTNVNPGLISSTRRLNTCDRILGGPGTHDHLFSELALRWNGTNAPTFTPANIYNCMVAPLAPQNLRLLTAGAGGTFVGAVKPVGLIGGFQP